MNSCCSVAGLQELKGCDSPEKLGGVRQDLDGIGWIPTTPSVLQRGSPLLLALVCGEESQTLAFHRIIE